MVVTTTVAGTAGAVSCALSTIRTTDAFDAFFLGFVNIQKRKTQDHNDNADNQIIDRVHRRLLSADSIVFLYLLVCVYTQINQNCGKGQQENQTANKACAQAAGGDQGADLVDQEAYGVAGAQLQTDAAPEPLLVLDLGVHCAHSSKAGGREQIEH